jgi:uncharacterized protein (TIGR02145 family)
MVLPLGALAIEDCSAATHHSAGEGGAGAAAGASGDSGLGVASSGGAAAAAASGDRDGPGNAGCGGVTNDVTAGMAGAPAILGGTAGMNRGGGAAAGDAPRAGAPAEGGGSTKGPTGATGNAAGTVGCGPETGATGHLDPGPDAAGTHGGGAAGGDGSAGTAGLGGATGMASAGTAGVAANLAVAGASGNLSDCSDRTQDGRETDVDCGGGDCDPCDDWMRCEVGADCRSAVCSGNACQSPACDDGVKNGTEACDGDDLGGATCEFLGLGAGPLTCGDDCALVTRGCTGGWRWGDRLVDARNDDVYSTIALGDRCWMANNLDVGERIPTTDAQVASDRIQKYCYGDDESMCTRFGGLYQWDHAMQFTEAEGAAGVCPAGWHIPTDQEWKDLEIVLGMDPAVADQDNWRGPGIGTALKVGGSSGFDAPLGGMAVNGSSYNYPGYGYFWTSTLGTPGPWRRCLTSETAYPPDTVGRWQTWGRQYALPIRCVTEQGL